MSEGQQPTSIATSSRSSGCGCGCEMSWDFWAFDNESKYKDPF
jgi:hypothetical protein